MNLNLKPFFTSKKIIISRHLRPAELVYTFTFKGKKFARIAFTHLIKYVGKIPVTDVAFEDIIGIKKLPSPFKKWMYSRVGLTAKPIQYWKSFKGKLKKSSYIYND